MFTLLRHRLRNWSTIAFLAIFGLVFAPTVSHALAQAQGGTSFQEVCGAPDMKLVSAEVGLATGDGPAAGLTHPDHCPLCNLGAHVLAMPMAMPALPRPEWQRQVRPAVSVRASKPIFAGSPAQPRAPPSLR